MATIALPTNMRVRPTVILGWVLGGLGGILLLLAAGSFPHAQGYGFDLDCYLGGAIRLAGGEDLYLPRLVEAPFRHGGPDVYVYPPPFAIALVPFAGLSFGGIAMAWFVVRIWLLVGACALLPLPGHQRAAAFGVMAFSISTLIDLNLGNVSLLVLFLLVVAWQARDRALGGAALAFSAALRPTAGLMLLWAGLRGHRRFLVGAIVVGALIFVASLPFVGLDGWLDYTRVLRNVQVGGHPRNGALESVAISLGLQGPLPTVFQLAGVALALGAMVAAFRRRDEELAFVVTLMASQFITPLLWEHYLVTLLVPAAFLAARGRPWALAMPLLAWLPHGALAVPAILGLLLPFLPAAAPRRGRASDRGDGLEPQTVADPGTTLLESPGR